MLNRSTLARDGSRFERTAAQTSSSTGGKACERGDGSPRRCSSASRRPRRPPPRPGGRTRSVRRLRRTSSPPRTARRSRTPSTGPTGRRPKRAGYPRIARVFLRTSHEEFKDHFVKLAALAGIVDGNAANLHDAITGEDRRGHDDLPAIRGASQRAERSARRRAVDGARRRRGAAPRRIRAGTGGDHAPALGRQGAGGSERRPVPDRRRRAAIDRRHAGEPVR